MLRDDGFGTDGVAMPIKLTLRFRPDHLIVDFTGTAPQARGAINMPYSNTLGQVYSTIHKILAPEVVFNAGFVKPIEVIAPEGTLVNPRFPGAVGGRAPLFFLITEIVHLALAEVIPDQVAVPQEGGDIVHMSGYRPDGSEYTTMDLVWGGWGGRPLKDGIDGAGMSYILGARRTGRTRSAGRGGGLWTGARHRRRGTPSRLTRHFQELSLPPSGQDNGAHQSSV